MTSHHPLLDQRFQRHLGAEGHCDTVVPSNEQYVDSSRQHVHPTSSQGFSPNHIQQQTQSKVTGVAEFGDTGQEPTWHNADYQHVQCSSGGDGWSEYWMSNPAAGTDSDMQAEYLNSFRRCKKTPIHAAFQTRVYNFLERPTGWKCFIYHFSV